MIKKHIPNTLTCCNLLSGCVAASYAYTGLAREALCWIIVGAVFDFFDGMSARLLGVSSPIGKELDSLADNVTFGVAPATIVFFELSSMDYPTWMTSPLVGDIMLRDILPLAAFALLVAFSAVRLAKFNIDTRQTTSFIGLPTPANALFWASLIATKANWLESSPWMPIAMFVMVCISSWLMVSEIPMFALKFKHWGWEGNHVKYSFIALSLVLMLLFGLLPSLWIVITCYFVISVTLDIFMPSSFGGRLNIENVKN